MSVVEIVIAAFVIVVAVTGISGAWRLYIKLVNAGADRSQAAALVEEAGEALDILRDQAWTTNIAPLALETTYYLSWNGSAYSLSTTATTSQSYTRTLVFHQISRDGSNNISASGTADPKTRQATITVYPANDPSNILSQADMLIHDVFNN